MPLTFHHGEPFPGTRARRKRSRTFGVRYSGIYHVGIPAIQSWLRYKTIGFRVRNVTFRFLMYSSDRASPLMLLPVRHEQSLALGREPKEGKGWFWSVEHAGQ